MTDIFDKWIKKYPDSQVLKDGILDSNSWQLAKRKVLIILKEDYDSREEFGFDLREAFKNWAEEGATKPTLRRLYLATYAIHYSEKELPQNNEEWEQAEKSFISSALINLKKVVGQRRSNWYDIDKFTSDNVTLIEEQILENIKPDIIVCGGTFGHLKQHMKGIKPHSCGFTSVYDWKGISIIEAYHPAFVVKYSEYHDWIRSRANVLYVNNSNP